MSPRPRSEWKSGSRIGAVPSACLRADADRRQRGHGEAGECLQHPATCRVCLRIHVVSLRGHPCWAVKMKEEGGRLPPAVISACC